MRIGNRTASILVVLALLSFWQLSSNLGFLNPIIISSPVSIANHILLILTNHGDVPDFYANLLLTVQELLAAFSIVVCVGIPLGISIGWNRSAGLVFVPLILAFFSIPNIVLYPVLYLIFGLGIFSKIAFGILVGLYVVIENSASGAQQVKKEHLVLASSLGFGGYETFRKIVLPAAFPAISTGLKLGLSLTFIGIIAGEIIASRQGLGSLITNAFELFRTSDLYALVLIVISISSLGNTILAYVEGRAGRHRHE